MYLCVTRGQSGGDGLCESSNLSEYDKGNGDCFEGPISLLILQVLGYVVTVVEYARIMFDLILASTYGCLMCVGYLQLLDAVYLCCLCILCFENNGVWDACVVIVCLFRHAPAAMRSVVFSIVLQCLLWVQNVYVESDVSLCLSGIMMLT